VAIMVWYGLAGAVLSVDHPRLVFWKPVKKPLYQGWRSRKNTGKDRQEELFNSPSVILEIEDASDFGESSSNQIIRGKVK
jgi:hypothetical protein